MFLECEKTEVDLFYHSFEPKMDIIVNDSGTLSLDLFWKKFDIEICNLNVWKVLRQTLFELVSKRKVKNIDFLFSIDYSDESKEFFLSNIIDHFDHIEKIHFWSSEDSSELFQKCLMHSLQKSSFFHCDFGEHDTSTEIFRLIDVSNLNSLILREAISFDDCKILSKNHTITNLSLAVSDIDIEGIREVSKNNNFIHLELLGKLKKFNDEIVDNILANQNLASLGINIDIQTQQQGDVFFQKIRQSHLHSLFLDYNAEDGLNEDSFFVGLPIEKLFFGESASLIPNTNKLFEKVKVIRFSFDDCRLPFNSHFQKISAIGDFLQYPFHEQLVLDHTLDTFKVHIPHNNSSTRLFELVSRSHSINEFEFSGFLIKLLSDEDQEQLLKVFSLTRLIVPSKLKIEKMFVQKLQRNFNIVSIGTDMGEEWGLKDNRIGKILRRNRLRRQNWKQIILLLSFFRCCQKRLFLDSIFPVIQYIIMPFEAYDYDWFQMVTFGDW